MPALMTFSGVTHRVVAPHPPRYDAWPPAVRAAWRISGALVRCGPGVRGIGWPETPIVRLAALGEWLNSDMLASHRSAAWVWGTARRPGVPIEVSMRPGVRRPLITNDSLRIRETRTTAEDLVTLGEFTVTTPRRTAIDLLYTGEHFGITEQVSCRLLAQLCDGGISGLKRHIDANRRPHRRVAQARIALMLSSVCRQEATQTP